MGERKTFSVGGKLFVSPRLNLGPYLGQRSLGSGFVCCSQASKYRLVLFTLGLLVVGWLEQSILNLLLQQLVETDNRTVQLGPH